jgi:hypothetical protein
MKEYYQETGYLHQQSRVEVSYVSFVWQGKQSHVSYEILWTALLTF